MSSAHARFTQAGPALLLTYLTKLTLALVPAYQLSHAHHAAPSIAPSVDLLTWLVMLPVLQPSAARDSGLVAGVAMLALAPLLRLTCLSSMVQRAPLRKHVAVAATHYLGALRVSLLCIAYAATCIAAICATGIGVETALAFTHDERLRDLAALAACLPLGCAWLHACALHDVASTQLVLRVDWRSALRAAAHATSLRIVVQSTLWSAAGAALGLAGLLLPRALLHAHGHDDSTAVLLYGQLTALAVTLLRGRWLASLVARLSR